MADLHQSAGLYLQSEATQENPQNLSTARTAVLCYVIDRFPHPHTKEKSGLAMRGPNHPEIMLLSATKN